MSEENKKINENDPKAKMLAALAKKQKSGNVANLVDQVLGQKLAQVKPVDLRQRCIGEKPAQHKNKD